MVLYLIRRQGHSDSYHVECINQLLSQTHARRYSGPVSDRPFPSWAFIFEGDELDDGLLRKVHAHTQSVHEIPDRFALEGRFWNHDALGYPDKEITQTLRGSWSEVAQNYSRARYGDSNDVAEVFGVDRFADRLAKRQFWPPLARRVRDIGSSMRILVPGGDVLGQYEFPYMSRT